MKNKKILHYGVFAILILVLIFGGAFYRQWNQKKELHELEKNAIQSVDDMAGKKVGVQIGTTGDIYVSDYEGDDAGTVVERYNKGTDAIQALKNGKIDCVVIDEQPALAYTERNAELKILQEEFALEEYAICIDKSQGDLKQKINQALEKLKSEGILERIIRNYVGKDDEKGENPV